MANWANTVKKPYRAEIKILNPRTEASFRYWGTIIEEKLSKGEKYVVFRAEGARFSRMIRKNLLTVLRSEFREVNHQPTEEKNDA